MQNERFPDFVYRGLIILGGSRFKAQFLRPRGATQFEPIIPNKKKAAHGDMSRLGGEAS